VLSFEKEAIVETAAALGPHQLAMIIAVIAMGMMDVAIDEKIRVVAMRNCGMPAAGRVMMPAFMRRAPMLGRARVGIDRIHVNAVLVNVVAVYAVEVAVVEVVGVAGVPHRHVFAIAVDVIMGWMRGMRRHLLLRSTT
jgi:hypothetical protein